MRTKSRTTTMLLRKLFNDSCVCTKLLLVNLTVVFFQNMCETAFLPCQKWKNFYLPTSPGYIRLLLSLIAAVSLRACLVRLCWVHLCCIVFSAAFQLIFFHIFLTWLIASVLLVQFLPYQLYMNRTRIGALQYSHTVPNNNNKRNPSSVERRLILVLSWLLHIWLFYLCCMLYLETSIILVAFVVCVS